jgi:serine protease AprX
MRLLPVRIWRGAARPAVLAIAVAIAAGGFAVPQVEAAATTATSSQISAPAPAPAANVKAKTVDDLLVDAAKQGKIKKIDRALAGELDNTKSTHKVIVTLQPGFQDTFRQTLQQRGRKIRREYGSLNLFVADLPSADVLEFAKHKMVKAISLDAPISTSQISVPVVSAPPSVTASAAVLPGAPIVVTIAGGPANSTDWVALSPANAPDTTYGAWAYLNGLRTAPLVGLSTATIQLTAPSTPGTYNVRFYASNGWTKLATSATINVGPTLTVPVTTVRPGGVFSVNVSGAPGSISDWLSVTDVNAADGNYTAWSYLSGNKNYPATPLINATIQFVAPTTPGNYNVRLFANDSWKKVATSVPISVQGLAPTVTVATTVKAGAQFTVTVANGPANVLDWVTLSPASAPDAGYLTWMYLNGQRTIPPAGLSSASFQFMAPMIPGTYNIRLFANNGWSKLATSGSITVEAAPSVTTLRQTLGLPTVADPTATMNVGVAVIDSGITPSDDFSGRITGFYDFTHGLNGVAVTPYDPYGHGTHVAGLIASKGTLSNYEIQGVAPAVRLVGLKVLDATGGGNTSDVIAALQFVTAHKSELNVQIVNMSLGHPIYAPASQDPLVQAVEQATAAGLIVVTSSGNYGRNPNTSAVGYAGITSPCNAPSAICVGAAVTQNTVSRADDQVADFSSRGPSWYDGSVKPDVIAPGDKLASDTSQTSYLYTRLRTSQGYATNSSSTLYLSGTSMSAGVVSGVVALAIDAHNRNAVGAQPPLTANVAKAILQFTAIPLAGADYLMQGAGEVNAAGAIDLAGAINTAQPVGSWWLMRGVTPATAIGDRSEAWSQNILWGDTVRGGNILYTHNIVWGENILWGENITWGENVPLAENIVWGENLVWGESLVWDDRYLGQRLGGNNILWGENIVWGEAMTWAQLTGANAVWGTKTGTTVTWGTMFGNNITWGETNNITWGANILWGENVVWGANIIWGENIVWGENLVWGQSLDAVDETVWEEHAAPDLGPERNLSVDGGAF